MKPRIRMWMLWASFSLLLYASGYSVARWRKFVVMCQTNVKESRLVIRRTEPGFDIRENLRGRFKNTINPGVYLLFRPAEFLEDCVRGGARPIQSNHPAGGNAGLTLQFGIKGHKSGVPQPGC